MRGEKKLSYLLPGFSVVSSKVMALARGSSGGLKARKLRELDGTTSGSFEHGVRPGTLYGSLGRMIEAGLIRESDKKVDPGLDDERRIYYAITGLGQGTLAAELERYREVVAVARRKQLA